MSYNPGVSYRGDQHIAAGFQNLIGGIGRGLDRRAQEKEREKVLQEQTKRLRLLAQGYGLSKAETEAMSNGELQGVVDMKQVEGAQHQAALREEAMRMNMAAQEQQMNRYARADELEAQEREAVSAAMAPVVLDDARANTYFQNGGNDLGTYFQIQDRAAQESWAPRFIDMDGDGKPDAMMTSERSAVPWKVDAGGRGQMVSITDAEGNPTGIFQSGSRHFEQTSEGRYAPVASRREMDPMEVSMNQNKFDSIMEKIAELEEDGPAWNWPGGKSKDEHKAEHEKLLNNQKRQANIYARALGREIPYPEVDGSEARKASSSAASSPMSDDEFFSGIGN